MWLVSKGNYVKCATIYHQSIGLSRRYKDGSRHFLRIYQVAYSGVSEEVSSLGDFLRFYNEERLQQSLGSRTPADIYLGRVGGTR